MYLVYGVLESTVAWKIIMAGAYYSITKTLVEEKVIYITLHENHYIRFLIKDDSTSKLLDLISTYFSLIEAISETSYSADASSSHGITKC